MKTLNNFPVEKKNVLLRVDLNVPTKNGIVIDKTKFQIIKSTVSILSLKKNKIFLLSHFGRPNKKNNKKFSLKFLKKNLAESLSVKKIYFVSKCYGSIIDQQKTFMQPGEICLLENVRFHEGEEKNDSTFSKSLAKHFDVYINEAFSASHRKHASIAGVTKYLPSLAGNNFIKEIDHLNTLLNNSTKPKIAIIGGSKVSTKLKLLNNLLKVFDTIIIGGAMANTFLVAKGFKVGKSLVEKDLIINAKKILKRSKHFNTKLILPVDLICSNSIKKRINIKIVDVKNFLPDQIAFDIGNKTIELIKSLLLKSKVIFWNGPLGAFEYKPFDNGTNQVAKLIKKYTKKLNIITIAGGGDTVAAIKQAKVEKSFTYVSTAGGAFLEWLEGKESPGLQALKNNKLS